MTHEQKNLIESYICELNKLSVKPYHTIVEHDEGEYYMWIFQTDKEGEIETYLHGIGELFIFLESLGHIPTIQVGQNQSDEELNGKPCINIF